MLLQSIPADVHTPTRLKCAFQEKIHTPANDSVVEHDFEMFSTVRDSSATILETTSCMYPYFAPLTTDKVGLGKGRDLQPMFSLEYACLAFL